MKNFLSARALLLAAFLPAAACTAESTLDPAPGGPGAPPPPSGEVARGTSDADKGAACASPPPAEGPWGTWQMTTLNGLEGVPAEGPVPPIELELRADGEAYRWHCARPASADADADALEPCPTESRYECLVGTVAWDGARWRVNFPEIRVERLPEQGEVIPVATGDILVRYIYPTYSGGVFRRIEGAATRGPACTP
jgi:hypothetical protein